MMMYEANKKTAVVAYLLWFFVGTFGGHRFYCDRVGSGVVQLVITLISFVLCVVGIGIVGLIAVWVWVIVDAFLIPGWIGDHNNQLVGRLSR